MFDTLRRLIQRYGFFKREPDTYHRSGSTVGPLMSAKDVWAEHAFYTEEKRRNERLAAIARERDALKNQLAKAVRQKKARGHIYTALRSLSIEELTIEGRR